MPKNREDIAPQLIITCECDDDRQAIIDALNQFEQQVWDFPFNVQKVDFPHVAQLALWDGGKS